MIGYPNGLWDQKNNLPIARRGLSATPIYSNQNGKNEFLIDCACFPGSSGSPIYTYQQGIYQNGDGLEIKYDSLQLAGVLYAGPTAKRNAEILEDQAELSKVTFAQVETMIHLGYCIRSTEILKLKPALVRRGIKRI